MFVKERRYGKDILGRGKSVCKGFGMFGMVVLAVSEKGVGGGVGVRLGGVLVVCLRG